MSVLSGNTDDLLTGTGECQKTDKEHPQNDTRYAFVIGGFGAVVLLLLCVSFLGYTENQC